MTNSKKIQLKRIYDTPETNDGLRVFVDRFWPRGVKKLDAQFDLWMKELSPSNSLRKWFNHDSDKFNEFRTRYLQELNLKRNITHVIFNRAKNRNITLLYAARDQSNNHAAVLQEFLSKS